MDFSIIIPVYNCEATIVKCLDSLIKQNLKNTEIILIDDGSTDNSKRNCENYERRYSEVILLSQKTNMGVSSARNRGIKKSKGKYLLFIDADDFVYPNYMQIIRDSVINDYDLISFGHSDYYICSDGKVNIINSNMNLSLATKNLFIEDWKQLFLKSFFASPCNKIYKKEILVEHSIIFDKNCVCFEDYLFNLNYCKYVKSLQIIKTPLYYYVQKQNVILSNKRKWGNLFQISNFVASKTNEFITEKSFQDFSFLRRYIYTSFITEIEYIYNNHLNEFDESIRCLIKNKEFLLAIKSIKPCGKYFLVLRFSIFFNLHYLQKKILLKKINQGEKNAY